MFKMFAGMALMGLSTPLLAAPFGTNSLVVAGQGGSCSTSSGCPVVLREYDLANGQLRQTIQLPTEVSGSQNAFTLEPNAGGQLSLSQDGRFLSLVGFARTVTANASGRLSATAASDVPRVVARIDGSARVDTSTTLGAAGFSQVQPRAVASVDGGGYWVVGDNGGVRYAAHGANQSTQVSPSFANNSFAVARDGVVWTTPNAFVSRAIKIATMPASLQSNTTAQFVAQGATPGQSNFGGEFAGLALLDVTPEIPGVDLIYAARAGNGDIYKYRKDASGAWNVLGSVNVNSTVGVTARPKPGAPSIIEVYATANCGGGTSRSVCLIEDAAGYNGPLAATADVLIPAPSNGGLLGLAFAPSAEASGFAIGPGITGAWYDPAQAGHGLFVQVLPNQRFVAWWFTFSPSGEQAWFGGVGAYEGGVAVVPLNKTTGGRFIPNFDSRQVSHPGFGTLTFTYSGCDRGMVEFELPDGYGRGRMALTRLTLPAGLNCTP